MTHAWPTTDTFDPGTPDYDSGFLVAYTRFRPVVTDPAYLSGGSGYGLSSTLWTTAHQLYDGWGANSAANTAPGSSTLSGGWLWRVATVADCEASIGCALFANSSAIETNERRNHIGVGVRIQAGTLTSGGTTSAFIDGCSGYYGVLLYDVGLDGYFEIWRVNAGTLTRLQQFPVPPNRRTWAQLAPWIPRTLRLVCRTNLSGNVELELWSNTTRGGAVTMVASITDSSGSKLTAAGRAGFFSSNERSAGGITAAPVLQFFTAGPEDGPADFRDEFERLDKTCALAVSGGLFAGRVLTQSWEGDLWAAAGMGPTLIGNVSAGRIAISTNAAAVDRYFLSQRPASDPLGSTREATIRFAGGTTIPNPCHRKIGVVGRATHKAPLIPSNGYVLVAHRDDQTTDGYLRLVRLFLGGVVEIGSVSGVTLALNTEYDLRLDVTNDAVPSPLTGNVKIKGYLDGVQIVFVDQGIPGVSINALGTVTDASNERIQSGYGEGLYFSGPTGSNRNMACGLWDIGSVLAPVEVADEDHETIEIPAEADGAFGTFEFPLCYPIEETLTFERPVTTEFEADYKCKTALSDSMRTIWRAPVRLPTDVDADALLAFADDHRGQEIPFAWTPPDRSAAIVARFGDENLPRSSPAPEFNVHEPIVLEEVHA